LADEILTQETTLIWMLIVSLAVIVAGLATAMYLHRPDQTRISNREILLPKTKSGASEIEQLRIDFRNCLLRADQRERYMRLYRGKYPNEGEGEIIRRILYDLARDNR